MNVSRQEKYFAANQTRKRCHFTSCIRRCCKAGYIYMKKMCYANSSDILTVSLYVNKTTLVDVWNDSYKHFSVGGPNCTKFRINFPNEEFYIQEETKEAWVPKFNKSYNSSWYCVDESNGFTPFLCFTNPIEFVDNLNDPLTAGQQVDKINTIGMYLIFYQFL